MIYAVIYLFIVCCALYCKVKQLERKTDLLLNILQEHHEELYAHTESPFTIASDQHPTLN